MLQFGPWYYFAISREFIFLGTCVCSSRGRTLLILQTVSFTMLPIILLLLVTTLADSYTNPSLNEPLFYDSLCDDGGVLFSKFNHHEMPCVCFSPGVYEVHKTETCKQDLPPDSFRVSEKTTCVHISKQTVGITKLPDDSLATDLVTDQYVDCGIDVISVLKRSKRQAAPAATTHPANITDPMDEDFLSSGKEVGHELMRNQMNQYIEGVIAKLTGLHGDGSGGGEVTGGAKSKYPVIKLLEYTKKIMQRTCQAVNPDYFDLALNSFVNLQLETFHIKEPYVGYAAYKRIEQAMEKCLKNAKPHVFDNNITMPADEASDDECEFQVTDETYNVTILHQGGDMEEERNLTIPPHGSSVINGSDIYAEPLIETVWKMLVSTHSYCFMYFSDYFNDHHTYTVSLLPLFTNQIQEIWLRGYNVNSTQETKLYGGLLGNVAKIMKDVDNCVGVSRELTPYPWFMNRPPLDKSNVWRRKKRDVDDSFDDVLEVVPADRAKADDMVDFKCYSTDFCRLSLS